MHSVQVTTRATPKAKFLQPPTEQFRGLKSITATDTLDHCIIKATQDYHSYTAEEVADMLHEHMVDTSQVEPILTNLYNMGYYERAKIAGGSEYAFTLKRGMEMPDAEISKVVNTVKKYKDPDEDRVAPDPKGIIRFSEGLDVAIWKATSDRNRRTLAEISLILTEFGFDRNHVKDRVVKLYQSKAWFDRFKQQHTDVQYSMKKHVAMPTPEETVTMTSTPSHTKTFSPKAQHTKAVINPIGKVPPAPKPYLPQAPAIHVLSANDGLSTSIWKAVSDHKPYLASEVALLLEDIGVKPSAVSPRMSMLNAEGWFDTAKADPTPGGGRVPVKYTLKEGIPMPVNEAPYRQHHHAPRGKNKVVTQPEAEFEAQLSAPDLVAQAAQPQETPVGVVPLIDIAITIKGIRFTPREAEDLATALTTEGYGRGRKAKPAASALFSTTVTIKGMPFTDAEIETVTKELVRAGFGEHDD